MNDTPAVHWRNIASAEGFGATISGGAALAALIAVLSIIQTTGIPTTWGELAGEIGLAFTAVAKALTK